MTSPEGLTGQQVRDYDIGAEIGRGAHGVVYQARRRSDGRQVAAKVVALTPHLSQNPDKRAEQVELLQRFESEAEIIRQLDHPNIIDMLDFWHDEWGTWMVMSWLGGGNLRQRIERRGSLSPEFCAAWLDGICGALDVAHRAQVIHRDLKPDNILFDDEGRAILGDFGVAKRLDRAPVTALGVMVGSMAYLSPEQIMGEPPISPRTDIFALGLTLYEALTGQHPYSYVKGHVNFMMHLMQEPVPPLHEQHAHLPAALDAVLQRATAKNPAERYPDAPALAQAFRQAAGLM